MDIEKLKRECGVEERRVPGNLREDCGISSKRWTRNKDERSDNGPITAQRLFVALPEGGALMATQNLPAPEADLKLLLELQCSLAATTRLSAALGEFIYQVSRSRTKAPRLTVKCEEALDMSFAFAEFITKKVAEARVASANGKEGAK